MEEIQPRSKETSGARTRIRSRRNLSDGAKFRDKENAKTEKTSDKDQIIDRIFADKEEDRIFAESEKIFRDIANSAAKCVLENSEIMRRFETERNLRLGHEEGNTFSSD